MTRNPVRQTLGCFFHGYTPYGRGIAMMDAAAAALARGEGGQCLLMFEHPPTITLGVRAKPSSVLITKGELATRGLALIKSDRGGDATWHGPGQLVGYPVVNLRGLGLSIPEYISAIEKGIISWLHGFRLDGRTRPGLPGVWIHGGGKMASIGVRVVRGIAAHGFALNLAGELPGADAIVPCGLPGTRLTTLQAETGEFLETREAAPGVAAGIGRALGMDTEYNDLSSR
jgi:lipoyl(octanoyl) transferase